MLKEQPKKINYKLSAMKGKRPKFLPKSEVKTLYEKIQQLKMENAYLKK